MNDAATLQPQYWIAVVAQDRAERARHGAYAELSHGRAGILELLRPGDGYVTYSPRTTDPKGIAVQAFTTMGRVGTGALYRVTEPDGSAAFRLPVEYMAAHPAPIKPFLDSLTFIRNRQHWGAAFRFGGLRITGADYARIAAAMGVRDIEEQARAA